MAEERAKRMTTIKELSEKALKAEHRWMDSNLTNDEVRRLQKESSAVREKVSTLLFEETQRQDETLNRIEQKIDSLCELFKDAKIQVSEVRGGKLSAEQWREILEKSL